jgi:hypothetical protein
VKGSCPRPLDERDLNLFSVQNSRVNYNRLDIGGDKQDRTADLLHAMQALSQLSYTPKSSKPSIIAPYESLVKSARQEQIIYALATLDRLAW